MKTVNRDSSFWWGAALVALGLLLLAGSNGAFWWVSDALWSAVFLLGAGALVTLFVRHRDRWWVLPPAGALTGIALAILLDGAGWAGPAFLGAIGAGFLTVYLAARDHWWSLIPAGALLTLAVVAAVPEPGGGTVFFLGLALTFLSLALLARQRWAYFPAAGLLVLSALVTPWLAPFSEVVWPLMLIGAGAWLLLGHHARGPDRR